MSLMNKIKKEFEMGADFGNSMLKFYTRFVNAENKKVSKKECVKAMCSTTSVDNSACVHLKNNDQAIRFGVGEPLVAADKTKRRYLEESLLLGIAMLFGGEANDSTIRICVGLPLSDYTSERKVDFVERLAKIETLSGEVVLDGKEIFLQNVSVIITVYAEGLAAFYYYQEKLDTQKRWLIWDTGYQSIDAVGLSYNGKKWVIDNHYSGKLGLREMYNAIAIPFSNDNKMIMQKAEDIEFYFNNMPKVRTKVGEVDITTYSHHAQPKIIRTYEDLEMVFPDIDNREIVLVGGGAPLVNKLLDIHNKYVEDDADTLFYANVMGYYLRIVDMKKAGML